MEDTELLTVLAGPPF